MPMLFINARDRGASPIPHGTLHCDLGRPGGPPSHQAENGTMEQWFHIMAMWGLRSIAKLIYNSHFTMVYGSYNELVTGANLNQQTGGPHIVAMILW